MSKQELYDEILAKLGPADSVKVEHDWAKIKALLWLYRSMKDDPVFMLADASILTSFANNLLTKGYLTNKQLVILRALIVNYVNKLVDIVSKLDGKDRRMQLTMSHIRSNMRRFRSINVQIPD